MNQNWSPKYTNHAGQRGRGRERQQLGRETFIDQIIVRAGESSGPISTTCREPSSERPKIQQSLPHLELSGDFVSEESETQQTLGNNLEDIEDQTSIVQPIIEYHLFGQQVTQEEWDRYNAEKHQKEVEAENKRKMEGAERFLEEHEGENEETLPTLEFPIRTTPGNYPMKNIPISTLPIFHGLSSEDPNELFFKFDILCRSYDYVSDIQKLKIFLATLKGKALRWFMSLGQDSITTWNQMKQAFFNKYQEYCRVRERKEELFKMNPKEEQSLEDFVERLEYNVQRSGHPDLDLDILKTILLRGIKDEHLDKLNLMGKGDISKEIYQDILNLCRRRSRGLSRSRSQNKDTFSRVQKSAN